MKDYDAISETVFHYFEGYKTKDRERLERAFVVDIANMMGYWKNDEGEQEQLIKAETNWVFVNRETGRPVRVHPDFVNSTEVVED